MQIAVVLVIMKAALLAALLVPVLAGATPIGVLTIVEGNVVVIRGAQKFTAVEGMRLRADDIVHSADGTRIARIEWTEGGALDIGPATRLMLRPPAFAPDEERPASLYLMQGWIKLTAPAGAEAPGFAAARLDVPAFEGVVVARADVGTASVFVESGSAELIERRGSGHFGPRRLSSGQGFVVRGVEPGATTSLPPRELVQQMPRAFADSLPFRARRIAALPVEPPAADIAYGDIAQWIDGADAELRPALRQRWAAKARDPVFRSALIAELRSHPDWTRLVYPPKKKPATARPAATAVAQRDASPAVPEAVEAETPPPPPIETTTPIVPPLPAPIATVVVL